MNRIRVCPRCGRRHSGLCGIPGTVTGKVPSTLREWSRSPRTWDGKIEPFHPLPKKRTTRPLNRIPLPEMDEKNIIDDEEIYQLFGEFRRHTLGDIRCEVINGVLEVESELTDFLKKIPLPENVNSSFQANLKNDILVISFKKKNQEKEGKMAEKKKA